MKLFKLIVTILIDIVLFLPRVICWHGGDLLTKVGTWESRWYRS